MKRNIVKCLVILAIFVCGGLVGSPLLAMAATTGFWSGTIPTATTESLVVKAGDTILPDGYNFAVVNMKTGDVQTKVITVQNTGTAAWLVKPVVVSEYPDYVTATWSNPEGQSIVGGDWKNYTLTLTAIKASPSVNISISFTRE